MKKIKTIKDIEKKDKFDTLNEELVVNAIKDLALNLPYSKYNHNEEEVLTNLKQLVDGLYLRKYGKGGLNSSQP